MPLFLQLESKSEEDALNSNEPTFRTFSWGPWIVLAIGVALLLLGGTRFVLRHHLSSMDALYCCLALIPAGLLLFVINYVLHHAKRALVIPLVACGLLAFSSSVFDVSLGMVLIGVIAGLALKERKNNKRLWIMNPEKLFIVYLIDGKDPSDKPNREFIRASQGKLMELDMGIQDLHMRGEYLVFTKPNGTCAGMFLSSVVSGWREAEECELPTAGEH